MAMDPKSPPPGNIVFFGISEDNDLVRSYSGDSQDDFQALALDWLPKVKCHYVGHSHTEANKTVGFLMRDGAGAGSSEILAFLERLRDAYRNAPSSNEGRVVGRKSTGWLQPSASGVISSSSSSTLSSKLAEQQRNEWWHRQVKIMAAVDVLLLCLTMLTVWLLVCEGFQCVS